MEFRCREVKNVGPGWQCRAVNRAKVKSILEVFTARVASLHGSLLVLSLVVNFGRGELALKESWVNPDATHVEQTVAYGR
jgi:hypothetical protein